MLTSLRYFIEVVDRRGFTAAAKTLNVAQPTLTRSLQNLEFQFGCKLLKRNAGAFDLTPSGELLLRRGRMLLAEHQSMLSDLAAVNGRRPENVLVNGSLITSLHLLPQVMRRLALERPSLRVSLLGANDANYEWKRGAVLSGELDLALTLYSPANSEDGLVQEMLVEPSLKVMVRTEHPLVGKTVGLEDLLEYTWIALPGQVNQATIETEFRIRGLPLPVDTVKISEWRIALELLAVTDYVVVVPYHPALLADWMERFCALPLVFQVRPLAISVVTRPLGGQRDATRTFITTIKQIIDEHVQLAKDIDQALPSEVMPR